MLKKTVEKKVEGINSTAKELKTHNNENEKKKKKEEEEISEFKKWHANIMYVQQFL